MEKTRILSLLIAVVLIICMFSGCTKDDLPSDNEPIENTESTVAETESATVSTTKESPATTETAKVNLVAGMSASERKRINIFLSNFSEVYFKDYDRNAGVDMHQVLWFVFMHNEINTSKTFFDGEKMGISANNADTTAKKYLGVTIPRKTYVNPSNEMDKWEYADGTFTQNAASGASVGIFTVAKEMTDNGDGTFTVKFEVFELENMHDGVSKSYYEMDIKTARDNYRYSYSGTAVVTEKQYNGNATYELVSYDV